MLTHRYIAKIILEAETPLFVGSGQASLTSDAIVMRDAYGYPMIPGTSLVGVLRHELGFGDPKEKTDFFGWQDGDKGEGSKLRVSSAYLILDGKIPDGSSDTYLADFENLPTRQHVRINDLGAAEDKGLFDNEVVYKGCRFIFEMEARGTQEDAETWDQVIQALKSPLFRIGQGTRNGYGRLRVLGIKEEKLNLNNADDFEKYLNYDNGLSIEDVPCDTSSNLLNFDQLHGKYNVYRLELTPELGFIFGAGTGDDEVDAMPVIERVVKYDDDWNLQFANEEQILIPGSSVKGAIRHRTCFHYNRRKKRWAEIYTGAIRSLITGIENKAVYDLFGAEGGWKGDQHDGLFDEQHNQKNSGGTRTPKRGHVLINDVFLEKAKAEKILNHVTIDRFTGGAKDGHLFSEKVATLQDQSMIALEIVLERNDFDDDVIGAFEDALRDICSGLLPLGGMTTKGHGIFTGKVFKNNKKLFEYES